MTLANSARTRTALLVVAALASAACLGGAAALTWFARPYRDALTGPVQVTLAGSDVVAGLVPMALVVLAGLGAAFAARGVLRRVIGGIVILCGALVTVWAGLAMTASPTGRLAGQLTRPATAVGGIRRDLFGGALAVGGGILMIAAGLLVMLAADRARRMGTAYEPPAAQRAAAKDGVDADAGPGGWWRALDTGIDPTDSDGRAPGPDDAAATDRMNEPSGSAAVDPGDGKT